MEIIFIPVLEAPFYFLMREHPYHVIYPTYYKLSCRVQASKWCRPAQLFPAGGNHAKASLWKMQARDMFSYCRVALQRWVRHAGWRSLIVSSKVDSCIVDAR